VRRWRVVKSVAVRQRPHAGHRFPDDQADNRADDGSDDSDDCTNDQADGRSDDHTDDYPDAAAADDAANDGSDSDAGRQRFAREPIVFSRRSRFPDVERIRVASGQLHRIRPEFDDLRWDRYGYSGQGRGAVQLCGSQSRHVQLHRYGKRQRDRLDQHQRDDDECDRQLTRASASLTTRGGRAYATRPLEIGGSSRAAFER
jgi:hypothetical protein